MAVTRKIGRESKTTLINSTIVNPINSIIAEKAAELYWINEEKKKFTNTYDKKRKELFELMKKNGVDSVVTDSPDGEIQAKIKETPKYEYDAKLLSKAIPKETFLNIISVSKTEAKKHVPDSVLEQVTVDLGVTENVEVSLVK